MDLKAKYGITLEDYAAMLERQDGQCAICGTADEKLVVDHNHTTGRVRSLLCHLCNALIGCAREDVAILCAPPRICTPNSTPSWAACAPKSPSSPLRPGSRWIVSVMRAANPSASHYGV
jgi:recombination endonuclease VII